MGRVELTREIYRRGIGIGLIVGVSISLLIFNLYQHFMTELPDLVTLPAIALSLFLIFISSVIWEKDFEAREVSYINVWMVLGMAMFSALTVVMVYHQGIQGVELQNEKFLFINYVTAGAVGGALIGFLYRRQVNSKEQLDRYRAELEETVEELEEANKELEQFAYVASHDLQEPLRMITSYLDLLEREYGEELDDEGLEYVDYASDGALRLKGLIEDLLKYSRVGGRKMEKGRVDLSEVLDDVLLDLRHAADEAGAEIERESLPEVSGDPSHLYQLFENLVGNAVRHGGESPRVEIGCGVREGEYEFTVSDDGPGIPEEDRPEVFQAFTQGAETESGTGMGLAICKRIVEAHGGEIWIDSEAGDGTTIHFTLPREVDG